MHYTVILKNKPNDTFLSICVFIVVKIGILRISSIKLLEAILMTNKEKYPEFEPDQVKKEEQEGQKKANENEERENDVRRNHDLEQRENDANSTQEFEEKQNNQQQSNESEKDLNNLSMDIAIE
jgi:hypothetical protein